MLQKMFGLKKVNTIVALLIATLTAATFATAQVEASSGPISTAGRQKQPGNTSAEIAAKVVADKEMDGYSTVILEQNPELAAVTAAQVMKSEKVVSQSVPVVAEATPLNRDFRLASHYLLQGDFPAAATEIRAGAELLKAEGSPLKQGVSEADWIANLAVRDVAVDQLAKLANHIELGQVSIKQLDAAMTKAYLVDLKL